VLRDIIKQHVLGFLADKFNSRNDQMSVLEFKPIGKIQSSKSNQIIGDWHTLPKLFSELQR
jgi:uncharacterized pyridoxal phosphate-containing UPF0001 family protein